MMIESANRPVTGASAVAKGRCNYSYRTWSRTVKTLSPIERNVLWAIADKVDAAGTWRMTLADLIEITETSLNTIRRALDKLAKRELLVFQPTVYKPDRHEGRVQGAHCFRLIRNEAEKERALAEGFSITRQALDRAGWVQNGRTGWVQNGRRVVPLDGRRVLPLLDGQTNIPNTFPKDDRSIDAFESDEALIRALLTAIPKIPAVLLNASDVAPLRGLLAEGCDLQRDVIPAVVHFVEGCKGPLRTFGNRMIRDKAFACRDAAMAARIASPPPGPLYFDDDRLARLAASLETRLGTAVVAAWFAGMRVAGGEHGGAWRLTLPHTFLCRYVESHYERHVAAALVASGLPFSRIEFVAAPTAAAAEAVAPVDG